MITPPFPCSWVRTRSTEPSCWTSATRRLWRTQSTTASSSATWTWSRWTTATSTTAMISRDTLPLPWTSLASGEVMGFQLAVRWDMGARCLTAKYLLAYHLLMFKDLSLFLIMFRQIWSVFFFLSQFKYAMGCLIKSWQHTVFVVTDNKHYFIWLNLITLWNPSLKPELAWKCAAVHRCQFLFGDTSAVLTRAYDGELN